MPEAWHDELRQALKNSLDKLASTEQEIARNNSPDALQAWVTGRASDLASKLR
jgi:hypothetical protein